MDKSSQLAIRSLVRIPILDGETYGTFISFSGLEAGPEHFAIQLGVLKPTQTPLVRVHSECMTGDVFGSQRCDCGPQLHESLRKIARHGGFLLYLRQEGRGIGLYAKFDAYVLQDQGFNTFEANRWLSFPDDMRSFEVAAHILRALGHDRIKLLTNNPDKVGQLREAGVAIEQVVPTQLFANQHNHRYLAAKAHHAQHNIVLDAVGQAPTLSS